MKVYINKVFKDIISLKYDKTNIAHYMVLMFVMICLIMVFNSQQSFIYLIFCVCAIINLGYMVLTAHNEIFQKKQVFPAIKDFFDIFSTGFKALSGMFLYIAIIWFVAIIIAAFGLLALWAVFIHQYASTSAPLIIVPLYAIITCLALIIIYIILVYLFLFPIFLNYCKTLQFKDFFNFRIAAEFRKTRGKYYNSYIFKMLLLTVLFTIVSSIITFILTGIVLASKTGQYEYKQFSSIINIMIINIFHTLIQPGLFAQTVGRVEKISPKNKKIPQNNKPQLT